MLTLLPRRSCKTWKSASFLTYDNVLRLRSDKLNSDFNLTAVPLSFLTPLSLNSSSHNSPLIGCSESFSTPTIKYCNLESEGFPIISTFLYSSLFSSINE